MKYCPFCGAELQDGAVSFCSACGKRLNGATETSPNTLQQQEAPKKAEKEKKKHKKGKASKHPKQKREKAKKQKKAEELPEIMGEAVDDGYDGYYNDILPPDTDRVKDGLDKELIKKIVALCIGVSVIILMCVALLYVL